MPPWLDLAAMRTAIAAAMARSKREIPHYYLEHQVDVTACGAMADAAPTRRRPPDKPIADGRARNQIGRLGRAGRFPAFNGFYREASSNRRKRYTSAWQLPFAAGGWQRRLCTMPISYRSTS